MKLLTNHQGFFYTYIYYYYYCLLHIIHTNPPKKILVIVAGSKSMISIACLHHRFCNFVHVFFEMVQTCVLNDFFGVASVRTKKNDRENVCVS